MLKLDLDDARVDTPVEIKDIIRTCSHYDRDKRFEFTEANFELY